MWRICPALNLWRPIDPSTWSWEAKGCEGWRRFPISGRNPRHPQRDSAFGCLPETSTCTFCRFFSFFVLVFFVFLNPDSRFRLLVYLFGFSPSCFSFSLFVFSFSVFWFRLLIFLFCFRFLVSCFRPVVFCFRPLVILLAFSFTL